MSLTLFDQMGAAEEITLRRLGDNKLEVSMGRAAAEALVKMMNGVSTTDLVQLCAARKFIAECKAAGVQVGE